MKCIHVRLISGDYRTIIHNELLVLSNFAFIDSEIYAFSLPNYFALIDSEFKCIVHALLFL